MTSTFDKVADIIAETSEIDRVTRQLAEGAMDDLAIKDRYLEYRFGGIEALSEESKG